MDGQMGGLGGDCRTGGCRGSIAREPVDEADMLAWMSRLDIDPTDLWMR